LVLSQKLRIFAAIGKLYAKELPTKGHYHACKKVESGLQKGREVPSKVIILSVFVKIQTGFIKTQAGFDKITAAL
jgi:hypothetical protein